MLIDTHSHLFVEEFTEDLPLVMERAQKAGVSYIFMPTLFAFQKPRFALSEKSCPNKDQDLFLR